MQVLIDLWIYLVNPIQLLACNTYPIILQIPILINLSHNIDVFAQKNILTELKAPFYNLDMMFVNQS
jgi:hypothetical protein